MCFSFLRVLNALNDECKDIIQLLTTTLAKRAPLLERLDKLTDQYWAQRIKKELTHEDSCEEVGFSLTEDAMPESGTNGEMDWVMVTLPHTQSET